ncbi:RagB/SusD family nutrient uptake outer membrane protein [Ekhidna sp.]|uniref:RagB/SusD family nutrient uptake outer membrane protein n=1 Tax=Ekhidna sp. TaxID=2608089 RepID=UPI003B500A07
MKNVLLSTLVLALVSISCDDLLDIEASNSLSGDLLVDEESIQLALNGAYFNFMGISDGGDGGELLGGDFQVMAELMVRNDQFGFDPQSSQVIPQEIFWDESAAPTYENFVNKSIIPTNLRVESNWRRAYETINLINNILANIDNVENGNARSRIQGEATAMRGILYFEMARLWGPQFTTSSASTLVLPLLTEPIISVDEIGLPSKSSLGDIYDRAELDLTNASADLQSLGTNGTRISYYACQAYLARLNMQKNQYDVAQTHLENILDGTFTLTNEPMDAFNNATNSTEDILAIQQTPGNNTGTPGSGSGLATLYSSLTGEGLSAFRISPDAISSDVLYNNPRFSDADLRATVDLSTTTSTTDVSTAYYRDPINTAIISSAKFLRNTDVVPVIRLAEVYLNRAECIYEQNTGVIDATALNDLNMIRQRAGIGALSVVDLNGDPDQFYDSLIQERNRELIYEGHVLHDIRRQFVNGYSTGILVGGRPNPVINPLDPDLILPIPQSECDASPGLCN